MTVSLRIRTITAITFLVVAVIVASCLLASRSSDPGSGQLASADTVAAGATRRMIVTGLPGREAEAERATVAAGGRVTRRLAVIHGFAAEIPVAAVGAVASSPAVVSVTPDTSLSAGPAGGSSTPAVAEAGQDAASSSPGGSAKGANKSKDKDKGKGAGTTDTGTMSAVTEIVGAQEAWASGTTGSGVDVALIDTGVAPVPGLDAAGKILTGPDLSFDATGAPAPGLDAYGHGTFMAGVIAGRDDTAPGDPSAFSGVAPDARIVNVKVGAADGAVDVSQVIAAIDWVTQHAHDPGVNIRVLNLSFGTDGTQDYRLDPLAQAAEQAWKHGIVVVTAAGNDGRATHDLADPAADPYLIAAGGDDPNGTLDAADDRVPTFAQHGTVQRPVDVIAPATHLLGLRVPGSYVDRLPSNAGQVGDRFQRGSGTSQAAAVVSGVAALLLQRFPEAGPDQVKAMLTGTATPVLRGSGRPSAPGQRLYSGHGLVNVTGALAAGPGDQTQTWESGSGTGTLDGARGSTVVSAGDVPLTGQQDIFGHPFDSAAIAAGEAAANTWSGGIWNGGRWTGDGWTGGRWTTTDWTGTDWAGGRWTGGRWTSMAWSGGRWTGDGWTGGRWTGGRWTTRSWATQGWE